MNPLPYPTSWMNEAATERHPIRMLLLRMLASIKMRRINNKIGSKHHRHQSEPSNNTNNPTVKAAGRRCTTLSDSGYFLYKLMRAIPELCTCLKNFRKSVRRLCQTHASGNSRQRYPFLKMRILKSISSPKRIFEKPPND